MTRFVDWGLRARLLLLILLALVPMLALILYSAVVQQRQAAFDAERQALRVVRRASATHERLLGETRHLLTVLAQLPAVRDRDARACTPLFADILQRFPIYTNVLALMPNGDAFCAGLPLQGPVTFADRAYFQEALRTRQVSVSEYLIGRISGKPNLTLAVPVVDERGEVRAVLVAALDLSWLNRLLAEEQLPSGSTITVIDRASTILARSPNPEQWVGRTVAELPIGKTVLAHAGEGAAEFPGEDGVPRLYAFMPLGGMSEEQVKVIVGIPSETAFADAHRLLAHSLAWLGIIAVLAGGVAWLGSDRLVLRPIQALVGVTERLAAGDLGARAGLPGGGGEAGLLARAFDGMGEALQRQQIERQEAEEALRESEARYRAVVEDQTEVISRFRVDGTFTFVSDAYCRFFGKTP